MMALQRIQVRPIRRVVRERTRVGEVGQGLLELLVSLVVVLVKFDIL